MPENNIPNEQSGQTAAVQGQANAGNKDAASPTLPSSKPVASKPQNGRKADTAPETPQRSKRHDEKNASERGQISSLNLPSGSILSKAPVERSVIGKDNERIRDFINECPAMMLDSIRVVLHLAAHNGSEEGVAKMDMRIFNAYLNSEFTAANQNAVTFDAVRKHRRNRMRELMQKANRFLTPEQKDEIPYIVMDLAEREEFVNTELDKLRKFQNRQ